KVRLKIVVPYEFGKELSCFLKEKGILENQGIPLLIRYGLSMESKEEIEKLKLEIESKEIRQLWREYAIMKFQTYEFFMENKAMIMRLPNMLYENNSLKRRLKTKGLRNFIPKSEWENWSKLEIDNFYRKYVFTSRL
ncbi:MAG: hypothetical protein QXH87_03065, partial [Candidatus Bathyarchaeia archaeon]